MPEEAPLVWEDPLLLEEQLGEEERMVRDAAHAYCRDKLMPRRLRLRACSGSWQML